MFFIYNPRLVSQAGRRGFEPRLPLHLFNNLRSLKILQKSANGVQPSLPSSKLFILNGSVGKNASLPRWHSPEDANSLNLLN